MHRDLSTTKVKQYAHTHKFSETMAATDVRQVGGVNARDRLLRNRMAQTCDARDPRCNPDVATRVNNLLIDSTWVRPSMHDDPNNTILSTGQEKYSARVLSQQKCTNTAILRPQMPAWRQMKENPSASLETSTTTAHLDALRTSTPVPYGQQLRRIQPACNGWSCN